MMAEQFKSINKKLNKYIPVVHVWVGADGDMWKLVDSVGEGRGYGELVSVEVDVQEGARCVLSEHLLEKGERETSFYYKNVFFYHYKNSK